MGLINKMADTIRKGLRNFLNVTPAPESTIVINEGIDFLTSCVKNRIWYAGKSRQLTELYSQLDVPSTMFWKARMTKGREIRKIHVNIPSMIVDTIVNIIMTDFNGVEITSKNTTAYSETWKTLEKSNKLNNVLKEALIDIGIVGDGAFKISYDKSISENLIIEWYPAERVKFTYVRGRIREVIFYTDYVENRKKYQFAEIYGYGFIKYELYNENGKQIPLNAISKTNWIDGQGVTFDDSVMWAIPVIYGKSSLYKGRGKGLIEDKEGCFDSLDEAWSQWMEALRAGRVKTYIPGNLIPYDENTGKPLSPNPFDNQFIELGDMVDENGKARIQIESPTIQHESYLNSYITALDLCLQGIISPSTLGIDVKKLDNAEAQREKEKTTLYTRQNFIELLENVIPQLVKTSINADLIIRNQAVISDDIEIKVKFGEYANPSFESQVETVGKARQGGIMSITTSVDELYGDSKSEDWKAEEVQRIKEEMGIATVEETSEVDDIMSNTPIKSDSNMLNGAQIGSLMNVIKMVKEGNVTRNEAISIITATLGISRENAESFIEEQL